MTPRGRLYAGTSGFSYPSWRGGFYPPGSRAADFLRLYAARLPAVELNTSGYRMPPEEHLRSWAAATPPAFRFAIKMSRRITHGGAVSLAPVFCGRVRVLGERLGPILVQLPETRERDDAFLRRLLGSLDPELAYAFELRHPSWLGSEVDGLLEAAGAARVGALEGRARLRYLRLREPPYDEAALRHAAAALAPSLDAGIDVFCFFKHEDEPSGPAFAARLLALAGPL